MPQKELCKRHLNNIIVERLKSFMDNEARSCSMDFGCVTPEYVYRMWGGTVALKDIEEGLKHINLYDYK